jgi:hypothetical protein
MSLENEMNLAKKAWEITSKARIDSRIRFSETCIDVITERALHGYSWASILWDNDSFGARPTKENQDIIVIYFKSMGYKNVRFESVNDPSTILLILDWGMISQI